MAISAEAPSVRKGAFLPPGRPQHGLGRVVRGCRKDDTSEHVAAPEGDRGCPRYRAHGAPDLAPALAVGLRKCLGPQGHPKATLKPPQSLGAEIACVPRAFVIVGIAGEKRA